MTDIEIITKLQNYNKIESLLRVGGKTELPIKMLKKSQLDALFSPQQIKTFYVGGGNDKSSSNDEDLYKVYRHEILLHND